MNHYTAGVLHSQVLPKLIRTGNINFPVNSAIRHRRYFWENCTSARTRTRTRQHLEPATPRLPRPAAEMRPRQPRYPHPAAGLVRALAKESEAKNHPAISDGVILLLQDVKSAFGVMEH
jgi:hypothetical protein